jgi:hypothetical protein
MGLVKSIYGVKLARRLGIKPSFNGPELANPKRKMSLQDVNFGGDSPLLTVNY